MIKVSYWLVLIIYTVSYSSVAKGEPDLEYGEYLSSECTACHLLSGKQSKIPTIIGWDQGAFIAVMRAYKDKERKNEVMQNIAFRLGDKELKSLAAYFATIKPGKTQN